MVYARNAGTLPRGDRVMAVMADGANKIHRGGKGKKRFFKNQIIFHATSCLFLKRALLLCTYGLGTNDVEMSCVMTRMS
jgi:hypothetical protein